MPAYPVTYLYGVDPQFNPAELQVPGDVELSEEIESEGGVHGSFQQGKTKTKITATAADGSQIEFPVNSKIRYYLDGLIYLMTDDQGQPILVHDGGRRRRRISRRRRTNRRRSTRRHR